MQLSADVLVVGAGVAGCAVGWLMRQAGRDVLMLELRDAREKEKLCGGILGNSSLKMIDDIFGAASLEDLGPTYPPHLRTRSLNRERVAPINFATIERKRLDTWVLDRYLSAGGELRDRMRPVGLDVAGHTLACIDLRTNEEVEIAYRTLVGADGATSAVRRLATGRRQMIVPSIEGTVPQCCEDIIFACQPASLGYCWYIPAGDTANVGCMSYSDSVPACRTWLASLCESLGIEMPELRGAPIPTGEDVLHTCGEDIWLVGDAAGLASPTDGGGIHFALDSARMLADSLAGGTPYEKTMGALAKYLSRMADNRSSFYLLTNMRTLRLGDEF